MLSVDYMSMPKIWRYSLSKCGFRWCLHFRCVPNLRIGTLFDRLANRFICMRLHVVVLIERLCFCQIHWLFLSTCVTVQVLRIAKCSLSLSSNNSAINIQFSIWIQLHFSSVCTSSVLCFMTRENFIHLYIHMCVQFALCRSVSSQIWIQVFRNRY